MNIQSNKKIDESKKTDLLELTQSHIAQIIALALVMSFFIFMAGFFLGKKSAVGPFVDQIATDSFADKVSYAFSNLYDVEDEGEPESKEEALQENGTSDASSETALQALMPKVAVDADASGLQLYVAQIAGFGTKRAAERCVENLKNNGFAVTMKARKSTTGKGKEIIWYQVVTEPVEDREQLNKLVEQIKKIAKVKDVPIVMLEKSY